jgi:hypothetical protein
MPAYVSVGVCQSAGNRAATRHGRKRGAATPGPPHKEAAEGATTLAAAADALGSAALPWTDAAA